MPPVTQACPPASPGQLDQVGLCDQADIWVDLWCVIGWAHLQGAVPAREACGASGKKDSTCSRALSDRSILGARHEGAFDEQLK